MKVHELKSSEEKFIDRITVRLTPHMVIRLKEIAAATDQPVSSLIREIIKKALRNIIF